MRQALAVNWWTLVLRGIFALIFGIVALTLPLLTLTVLVLMFGIYVLLDGVTNVIAAWNNRNRYARWWVGLLEGIVGIVVGILTFIYPGITGLILLYMIAFWAVMTGILEIIAAVQLRQEISNEWLLALSGVLSVIFGVVLVIFPLGGAVTVAWLISMYAILFGVTLIALGLRLRSHPEGHLYRGSTTPYRYDEAEQH